jgi:hypothetical protein
VVRQRLVKVKA